MPTNLEILRAAQIKENAQNDKKEERQETNEEKLEKIKQNVSFAQSINKSNTSTTPSTTLPSNYCDLDDPNSSCSKMIQNLQMKEAILIDEIVSGAIEDQMEFSDVVQNSKNVENHFLYAVTNQNTSLQNNVDYLNGIYSADNQKIAYQHQHINYWVRINFWLFYIYVILALIYAIKLFAYGTGSLGGKIFWYLHILFLPYLAIYTEIATYLFFSYLYSWFTGSPFKVWHYFTSYPPIV